VILLRNAMLISVVMLTTACGMREDSMSAMNDKSNWFEYAYYSSPANLEQSADAHKAVRPIRLQ